MKGQGQGNVKVSHRYGLHLSLHKMVSFNEMTVCTQVIRCPSVSSFHTIFLGYPKPYHGCLIKPLVSVLSVTCLIDQREAQVP